MKLRPKITLTDHFNELVDYLRIKEGETTLERRYFISSLNAENHKTIARAIRKHWCIENQLHWVLDVSFNEDASRSAKR